MMAVTITTAGVVELVDTGDLKSPGRKAVRVQVPSPVEQFLLWISRFRPHKLGLEPEACGWPHPQGRQRLPRNRESLKSRLR